MGVSKVKGSFGSFAGTIDTGPGGLAAAGSVRVGSVDTGDRLRDSMLRGADFFEEQAFPEIAFRSTGSPPAGGDSFALTGHLTLRGSDRPLTLSVKVVGLSAETLELSVGGRLRRSEHGLVFRGAMAAGNRAVGDSVTIRIDLTAVPQA
jgi:polyisoprenoid-binding protein YceI